MTPLTISIPHQLSRAEARRRIEEQVTSLNHSPASPIVTLVHNWEGDTLQFRVTSAGQAIPGRAIIDDQLVRVEVELPWMFSLLSNVIKQQVAQQGQKLLEKPR